MSLIHTVSLIVVIISYSIDCWVLNEIDIPELEKQLKLQLQQQNDLSDDEDLSQLKFALIYPGTKWCGPGDIADGYDDLGSENETDVCCREHDFCPDSLSSGEARHNLTNEAYYTRMSCKCDEQFQRCLRKAKTNTANNIGILYFNLLGTKCYRPDYPVLKCTRKGGWLNRKCIEYSYDTSAKKIYQWFDVINY